MPHVFDKKKIRFSFIPQQPQRGLSSFAPRTTNGYLLAISQLTGLFPFIYRSISAATRYGFLIEALSLLRRKPQTAERHVSLSRGKFKACSCFWEANVLTALRIRTSKARLSCSRRYSAKRSPWRILHPQTLFIIS